MTPFTREAFFEVFADYNAAIWPAQIAALVIGAAAIAQICFQPDHSSRSVPSVLALLWLGNGLGYHYRFFSSINVAAYSFAALFVLEAGLFAGAAIGNGLRFRIARDFKSAAGLAFAGYAMVLYSALGILAGRGLMEGPMFGVAPCPTTIFTIGLLLLARGRAVIWLSIIPVLWSLVGLAAALQLGMPEDFGLPVASLVLATTIGVSWAKIRGTKQHHPPC